MESNGENVRVTEKEKKETKEQPKEKKDIFLKVDSYKSMGTTLVFSTEEKQKESDVNKGE